MDGSNVSCGDERPRIRMKKAEKESVYSKNDGCWDLRPYQPLMLIHRINIGHLYSPSSFTFIFTFIPLSGRPSFPLMPIRFLAIYIFGRVLFFQIQNWFVRLPLTSLSLCCLFEDPVFLAYFERSRSPSKDPYFEQILHFSIFVFIPYLSLFRFFFMQIIKQKYN